MYKNVRNISHSFLLDYQLIFAREAILAQYKYIYIYNMKVECASIQPIAKQVRAIFRILNITMLMTK